MGTRTIGQVRSHAQKYFQKQKNSGANSAVPAAGAKTGQSTTNSSASSKSPIGTPTDNDAAASAAKSGSESEGPATSGESSASASANSAKSRGATSGNGKHLPSHNTPWTPEEQKAFTEGLGMYGKGNWKVISTHIGSRTPLQVKYHPPPSPLPPPSPFPLLFSPLPLPLFRCLPILCVKYAKNKRDVSKSRKWTIRPHLPFPPASVFLFRS